MHDEYECEGIKILKQRAAKEAYERTLKECIKNTYKMLKRIDPKMTKKSLLLLISKEFDLSLEYVKETVEKDS